MSDRIETVIAETAENHEPVWAESVDMLVRCTCGHGHDIAGYDRDAHNAHLSTAILAALKAARIAVVELPEPLPSNDPSIAGEWLGGEVMAHRNGLVSLDWHSIKPRAARAYARALLAAAAAAVGARITVEEA